MTWARTNVSRGAHRARIGHGRAGWLLAVCLVLGMVLASHSSVQAAGEPALMWCKEPVEELSATRGRRVINGVWRIMPAVGAATESPEGQWGHARVPRVWRGSDFENGQAGDLWPPASSPPWDQSTLSGVARVWYEREILIPESWAGREVVLNIGRVCTDATVYVDGQECGRVNWPDGEVVLTPFVRAGASSLLRILVVATRDAGKVDGLLSGAVSDDGRCTWGLAGDVILESRPKGARVDGVFVQTSVRRGEIAVDVDLADVTQAGQVDFTARIMDADGQVARSFEASARVEKESSQTVRASWKWDDPRLWDFLRPNLYTLLLKARGAGLDDEYAQRFGFREFRIEGKQFLLNEKPFRLRPTVSKMAGSKGMREAVEWKLDSFVTAGFNFVELWPMAEMSRGSSLHWQMEARVADEKGVPLMYPALNLRGVIGRAGTSDEWARWEELMVREWKKVRNHPSIVCFVCTANAFQHADDQNPRRIGNREALMVDTSGERLQRMMAAGFKAMDAIRKYETTRPVTTHHGSAVGDFHTCDMYLDMIPLQEREEWLSAWAESEDAGPYMGIEFGTPWEATFHRGRRNGSHARTSEPFLTEYCAIYFGPDAYRNETDMYRALIKERFQGEQNYDMWSKSWSPDYVYLPNHLALQTLFIRNTWRSWRTWGLTGGLIPWEAGYGWVPAANGRSAIAVPEFEPGRLGLYVRPETFAPAEAQSYFRGLDGMAVTDAGKALVESNSSTLAWIAGPADAFTAKDHHFFPGETVRKQAVLINDEREEQTYEVSWHVRLNGSDLGSGSKSGTIGVAQNLFIPLEFVTTDVEKKTSGRIDLTARIGKAEHRDAFSFRVLPRPPAPEAGSSTVLAFDPEGATTTLLKRLGWSTELWDGGVAEGRVLVVGRHALDRGDAVPGSLADFVRGGGRLVVFGQDPEWLRSGAGFRVARHVARRFYPVASQAGHAVVRGLDSEDLRDWRGTGTLVPSTANDELEKDFSDWEQVYGGRQYGWHWGNRGSVSSAAIEKPHLSGWRPLLEGEFDLAYSPLMELHCGNGVAFWCTLDVEGRDQGDPVADTITARLLTYATEVEVEQRAPRTVYLGSTAGGELLEQLGLTAQTVATLPRKAALAVIGPAGRPSDADLSAFMAAGGKVFFMAREADRVPLRYRAAVNPAFRGGRAVPVWPECLGLSESDLRLRTTAEVPVLISGTGQGGADGLLGRCVYSKGVAVLMQLLPSMLQAEEKTYMRLSTWRVTRTIAQILSNMGAEMKADGLGLERLTSESGAAPDYYCADYIEDFDLGDDPYRYKRW